MLQVKQKLYNMGYIVGKHAPKEDVENFINRFREEYVSVKLQRIGGTGDGGYLVPDILDTVEYCFSPGVSDVADFESHLSKEYGIKSFLADASVSDAPVSDPNILFSQKYLGSRSDGVFITLSDWVENSMCSDPSGKILQMDIEGGEYDVLTYESSEFLSQFSSMIIEFHDMQNLFERNSLRVMTAIFEKIYRNFSICHVHPNNCCGIARYKNIQIPRVLEVTFIRKDFIGTLEPAGQISLPHPLDSRNVSEKDEIFMPSIWWKEGSP